MENAMNCSSLPDNQTADFIERFFPFTYNQILENILLQIQQKRGKI